MKIKTRIGLALVEQRVDRSAFTQGAFRKERRTAASISSHSGVHTL